MRNEKMKKTVAARKILSVVLAVMLVMSLTGSLAVTANIGIEGLAANAVNTMDETAPTIPVTISGTAVNSPSEFVSIMVLREGFTGPATDADVIDFHQTMTDVNGSFSFTFNFSTDNDGGTYFVNVGLGNVDGYQQIHFTFARAEDAQDAFDAINAATNANMLARILEHGANVGFNMVAFNALSPAANQQAVANVFNTIKSTFSNADFPNIVAMNNGFNEAMDVVAVRTATTSANVESAVRNATSFDVTQWDNYEFFSEPWFTTVARNAVWSQLAARTNYGRSVDIETHFNEQVVLRGVQHLHNSDISDLIWDNAAMIGLTQAHINTYNNTLSAVGRTAFYTAISGGNFATPDALRAAIHSELIRLTQPGQQGAGGSGPGGAGGGLWGNQYNPRPDQAIPVDRDPEQGDRDPVPNAFNDIAGHWATYYINAMAWENVIAGMGDGSFAPDATITREQFVTMLVRAFDVAGDTYSATFGDVYPNAWYADYISRAVAADITRGMGDGNFGIGASISRQDMAVMAQRLMNTLGSDLGGSSNIAFGDQYAVADYAVEAVAAMSAAGIITGFPDGSFQPTGNATRAQVAVIIYRLLRATGR